MVKVKVPATSANLGAGFDCLGLALELYNEVSAEVSTTFKIDTDKELPSGTNNLVYKAIVATFEYAKQKFNDVTVSEIPEIMQIFIDNPKDPLPLHIVQVNNIPKTSGLGSSAACNVSGVVVANKLLGNILSEEEMLSLATKLDGHPDNVTPALFGGVTASLALPNGDVKYVKILPKNTLKMVVCTPSFSLETRMSRRVLPPTYEAGDAYFSVGHAVLSFEALRLGDENLIAQVIADKLHEPYRTPLVPNFDSIKSMLLGNGALAVFLSGAGPSIGAFVSKKFDEKKMLEDLSFLPDNWHMYVLKVATSGAIESGEKYSV